MILVARRLVPLAIAIATGMPAAAQDWKGMGRMQGKVTDAAGAPLAGVSVTLALAERGGGTTATTDEKGRWVVGGIAAGTWHIDFERTGYASRKVSVTLPSESSRLAPLEVRLEKAAAPEVDPATRAVLERAEAAYKEGRFPEARAEYERIHAAVWPEILAAIHEAGIRNYSIFHFDGKLFAYFEYTGPDEEYEARMRELARAPRMREWWNITDAMQEPLEGRDPGDWWANMKEVFHCP